MDPPQSFVNALTILELALRVVAVVKRHCLVLIYFDSSLEEFIHDAFRALPLLN